MKMKWTMVAAAAAAALVAALPAAAGPRVRDAQGRFRSALKYARVVAVGTVSGTDAKQSAVRRIRVEPREVLYGAAAKTLTVPAGPGAKLKAGDKVIVASDGTKDARTNVAVKWSAEAEQTFLART